MQAVMYAAPAALAVALILLVVYHFCVVRPAVRALNAHLTAQDELIGGGTSGSGRLSSLEEACAEMARRAERADGALRELDALSRTDVSRLGFVRYDAFDDTGSELSYALALLNRQGDGVVLTSIYSRTDTRTYAKGVQGFTPVAAASAEELDAIARARNPVSS